MPSNKLVVGLTGGIGSGKTTVADLFAECGVDIIDADRLSRELTEPGKPAYHAIVEKFGPHVVMGNTHLNRRTIRTYVFNDQSLRQWLEQLLHPVIREDLARRIAASTSPYCMAVIPLLFEREPNPLITRTLVVDVPEEMQLARTQLRDLHTQEEVDRIMKLQVTREHRLGAADDVIYNDKKMEDLIPQVEKLHNFYLSLIKTES